MTESLFAPLGRAAPGMLFAGDFTVWATSAGLAQGFRAQGWDVTEVSVLDPLIASKRFDLRAAARLLLPVARRSHNHDIVAEAKRMRPRVFFTVKGNFITAATLAELRALGILTVNYYPDRDFEHHGMPDDALDGFDLVITSKSYQLPYLTKRLSADRVAMVHHGYVPDVHRRRGAAGVAPEYLWDVSFIGNASPDKLAWLEPVARSLGDRSMVVIGTRWRDLAKDGPVAPHVLGHALAGDEFARAIEHSRVNIAVHHGVGGAEGWADQVSTRTFEIPACGGFMLHIDNDEVRELYEPGREIDVFADADSLVERVHHHLAHPDERRAIAERGHARCVPAYSTATRAQEILSVIGQRL